MRSMRLRDLFPRVRRFMHLPEPPYYPTFIEKFLMAIICAYPNECCKTLDETELDRRQRLSRAIEALTLVKYARRGPTEKYDMAAQLSFINRKIEHLERREEEMRYPGYFEVPELSFQQAIGSALPALGGVSNNKKRRQYKKWKLETNQQYYWFVGLGCKHEEEAESWSSLQNIFVELNKHGVRMALDPRQLGLGSLWHLTPNDPK